MLGFFLLYFAAVFREHLSLAASVFILILQACFFQISVKSHDVINFWLHWIIFLNLFIFTNFYLWQVNFFTLTRKFCQVVFKKVSNNHSQLKQWSHQFLLLLSFFLTKSSFKIFTNWLSIQKKPSGDVIWGQISVSVQQIFGEYRCGCVTSIKLHMQLSEAIPAWWLFLSKHLLLLMQFLYLY